MKTWNGNSKCQDSWTIAGLSAGPRRRGDQLGAGRNSRALLLRLARCRPRCVFVLCVCVGGGLVSVRAQLVIIFLCVLCVCGLCALVLLSVFCCPSSRFFATQTLTAAVPLADKLCIVPAHYCWVAYVDVLVLETGGNLLDHVSIAIKVSPKHIFFLKTLWSMLWSVQLEKPRFPTALKSMAVPSAVPSGCPCVRVLARQMRFSQRRLDCERTTRRPIADWEHAGLSAAASGV